MDVDDSWSWRSRKHLPDLRLRQMFRIEGQDTRLLGFDHGLQHLRGGDHGFGPPVGATHDVLLNDRDSLDGHFHAEIAPGDHDAVRHVENLIELVETRC